MPELYVESRAGGREVPGLRARRKYTKRAVPAAGVWHTVGLKKDGTVVAVGQNETRQCDVSDWTDIIAISTELLYRKMRMRNSGRCITSG